MREEEGIEARYHSHRIIRFSGSAQVQKNEKRGAMRRDAQIDRKMDKAGEWRVGGVGVGDGENIAKYDDEGVGEGVRIDRLLQTYYGPGGFFKT
jgi:hypothetical protein